MNRGYGQYCPLALAAELLCERWSLLVVSRVIDGCTRFNQIHRGVPRISPSLLSQRLQQLERAGVVTRRTAGRGRPAEYRLTTAGYELAPIVEALAVWGQHWARDMTLDDLDPAFLVWSMHLRLNGQCMPRGRTVIEFEFSGTPTDLRRFWLVHDQGVTDMCLKDPGFAVDLRVSADLRLFIEAWRGIRDLRREIKARNIRVVGPSALIKQFPKWLLGSMLSQYPRKRVGAEQRRCSQKPLASV